MLEFGHHGMQQQGMLGKDTLFPGEHTNVRYDDMVLKLADRALQTLHLESRSSNKRARCMVSSSSPENFFGSFWGILPLTGHLFQTQRATPLRV